MAITDYILTTVARIAFPALAAPKKNDQGVEKYGCVLLFDKKTTDISILRGLVKKAISEEFGAKLPGNLKLGIKDGDVPNGNGSIPNGFAGHWVVPCSSKYKPGCYTAAAKQTMDAGIFYAGCYVIAQVNVFTFKAQGNNGASFGLASLQFVRDGEKLGGGAPTPAFTPVPGSEAAASAPGAKGSGDSLDDMFA